ncbi:MAG: tetratricopeptide repeat protein, partial [Planctomycetes bacterium]|nr:tetratricopeptide repeat protein [Planctomycetota bacterium]
DILKDVPGDRIASVLLARAYIRQAKLSEADALYHQLRKDQDTEQLSANHAEVLIDLGRIEDSQALLSQARQDYPDSVTVMLVEIKQTMAKLDYEEAVDLADKVIDRFADNTTAYILKARALSYNQRYQQSIECLRRLRGMVAPHDPLGRNLLWRVYWAAGRFGDAITEMKAMLRVDPAQPQFRQQLMRRLSDRGRWNELEQLYEESIQLYPDSIEMHLEAADSLMRHGALLKENADQRGASQKYAGAKTLLEQALELSQKQGRLKNRVTNGFVRYMLNTNQNQQVLELVDPAIAERKTPYTLLLYKAEALYRMGRDDDALSAFEQALEITSENMQTTSIVLDAMDRVATKERMAAWAREKLKSRSDWVSMHELLAQLYRDQDDHSKAIESLSEAVRTAKNPDRANRNRFQLATLYMMQDQHDLAITLFRQVLDYAPNNVGTLNNLAYILLDVEGAEEEAMTMAERAYQQARANPNVMDTYVVALLRKGDYEQAVTIMRQAISMSQRLGLDVIAEYYYHLAQGLVGTNQTDRAGRQLQNALSRLEEGHVSGDKEELRRQIESTMSQLNN